MTKHQAFVKIIQGMRNSGWDSDSITVALLHLDTHEPTEERVSLLARGFTVKGTEYQINAAEAFAIKEIQTKLSVYPEDSESPYPEDSENSEKQTFKLCKGCRPLSAKEALQEHQNPNICDKCHKIERPLYYDQYLMYLSPENQWRVLRPTRTGENWKEAV